MTADKEICKGCKHWDIMCSKLVPIKRWFNQNQCEKEAEGKYDKYKYGNGNTEADGQGD